MDPLSVIAGVAGIVSLGIQLSEILQKHIKSVKAAPERIQQIVIEIQATAHGIQDLSEFLEKDRLRKSRVISPTGERDFLTVIQRCDTIFRKVTTLVTKAGRSTIEAVDDFQRRVNKAALAKNATKKSPTLRIELTNLERLVWRWKVPEIDQCIFDLDKLKLSLQFRLTVAILGEISQQPRDHLTRDFETLEIKDQLFEEYKLLEERPQPPQVVDIRDEPKGEALAKKYQAKELLENWPFLSSGMIPSIKDLRDLGIKLSGMTFFPSMRRVVDVPIAPRELHEIATSKTKTISVKKMWQHYSTLSFDDQNAISHFVGLSGKRLGSTAYLVFLDSRRRYMRRVYERVKNTVFPSDVQVRAVCRIFVIVAYADTEDHAMGPSLRHGPIRQRRSGRGPPRRGPIHYRNPSTSRSTSSSDIVLSDPPSTSSLDTVLSDAMPHRERSSTRMHTGRVDRNRVHEQGHHHEVPTFEPVHNEAPPMTNYAFPAEDDKNAIARQYLAQWTNIPTRALDILAPPPHSRPYHRERSPGDVVWVPPMRRPNPPEPSGTVHPSPPPAPGFNLSEPPQYPGLDTRQHTAESRRHHHHHSAQPSPTRHSSDRTATRDQPLMRGRSQPSPAAPIQSVPRQGSGSHSSYLGSNASSDSEGEIEQEIIIG